MNFKESKTYLNLAKAFAGECQARTRYEFIEYGARKQGYKAMAELVDKVAFNEFNHARMMYTYLQGGSANETIDNIDICTGYPFKEKWDLLDNLRFAAEDEKFEAEKIYPEYQKTANEEGFYEVAKLFEDLIQVETCHHKMFKQLYTQLKEGTLYKKPEVVKWKCSTCGYEAEGKEAWDVCPLCKEVQGAVMLKIEDEN